MTLHAWFDGYPNGELGVLETAVGYGMYLWLLFILRLPQARRVAIRSLVGLPVGFAAQILAGWSWAEQGQRAFMIAAVVLIVVPVERLVDRRRRPSTDG